jgi:SAM-dependent methyltransferase
MNIKTDNYDSLKTYFDSVLNSDKSTYKSTNDEPTPIGCIEEMLSFIPTEFWGEKLRILDPCCGNGNFNLVAWNKSKESDLFFNDINENRIKNVKEVFGDKAIISTKDFFDFDSNKYDLIHFNPPYAKIMANGQRAAKNHTLVRDFVMKAFSLLKDGGYMVFIIPDNWMSLADRNEVVKVITSNQIIHLNVHGAKKWFPKIGSSFTWAVVQKTKGINPFSVECKNHSSTVESQPRDFIPLIYTSEVQSILSKTIDCDNVKFKVETSSDLHKYTKRHLIGEGPYRLIHTPKQTVWASRPHKYQDGYKVFISTTDKYKAFVDDCGMTQSIAFIRCESKEEAEKTKKILDHELYVFLNNICRWGNFNNIRILQRFPVPNGNVYKSFGITDEEIKFIQSVLQSR